MRPRPLTTAQQDSVEALLAAGRVAIVPVEQADDIAADLPNLTRPQNQCNLAYDACHDIGEALLAAYGYRTVNGPGQHEVLGRFLRAVFDHPPGQRAAQRFEQLRRSRNQQRYAARPVGSADAQVATQAAAELRAAAQAQGLVGS